MTAQTLYKRATAKRGPIELAALDPVEVIEALVGNRKAAEVLADTDLSAFLDKPLPVAMQEIAALPHVGPGIAAKVVLMPFWVIYMTSDQAKEMRHETAASSA